MKLDEYLDVQELESLVADGYVSARAHKDYASYIIFNYTPAAAHTFPESEWTDTLKKARGLIVHGKEIKAFGLHKFFNVNADSKVEDGIFAYDKLDGSLGIVYRAPDDSIQIATRGSFHSDQADWANAFLADNREYVEFFDRVMHTFPDETPHVEIIYKANQIVLDYDYDDLVLLGYQTPDFWVSAKSDDYPGREAESYYFQSFADMISWVRPNREGFVIQNASTMKLSKYKYEKYLELHRAVSNLTPKYIWEQMVAGTVAQFIRDLPNEFHADADKMRYDLVDKYERLEDIAFAMYRNALARTGHTWGAEKVSRGEFARQVMGSADTKAVSQFMFSLYDDNSEKLHTQLMQAIKP